MILDLLLAIQIEIPQDKMENWKNYKSITDAGSFLYRINDLLNWKGFKTHTGKRGKLVTSNLLNLNHFSNRR